MTLHKRTMPPDLAALLTVLFAWALMAVILLSAPAAFAYSMKMPTRGNALPSNTYMRTTGHKGYNCAPDIPAAQRRCALDISARRWNDETNSWSPWKADSGPNPLASASVMWGMPLYAPTDGHIIACWRRMPDDLIEGDGDNCPGGETNDAGEKKKCLTGGNFLSILTEDERLINLQHLREDSIPAALCPINGVYIYKNDGPKACNLGAGYKAYRDETRLDLLGIDPIPVKKGQFIGRAGTTGNSGGVHLHLAVREYAHDGDNPCKGPHLQMEFVESWYQQRFGGVPPNDDWIELDTQQTLPIDGTNWLLWPDPVGPRTDSLIVGSGTKPQVVLGTSNFDLALGTLAYRNAAGNLAVGAVNLSAGQLSIYDEEEEGPVSKLALTGINSGDHVVAAVVNGSDKLQVIPYARFGASLTRGVGRIEGAASRIKATPSPYPAGFVVAVRRGDNRLLVIDYDVDGNGLEQTISRNGSASSPTEVKDIDIATVTTGRALDDASSTPFKGVVTAERRTSDNAIVVRSWHITPSGDITQADSDTARDISTNTKFKVNDVDIAVVGTATREFVVVTSRLKPSLTMRSQTFEINADGHLRRIDQADAGEIGNLASTDVGNADVVTAVSTGTSNLALISWQIQPVLGGAVADGAQIRRSGTRKAGFISAVDVAANETNLLLAVRDANQEIKLITYRTNYWTSE